jgi:hypothetical protein
LVRASVRRGSLHDAVAGATHRVPPLVVGQQDQDIGPRRGKGGNRDDKNHDEKDDRKRKGRSHGVHWEPRITRMRKVDRTGGTPGTVLGKETLLFCADILSILVALPVLGAKRRNPATR